MSHQTGSFWHMRRNYALPSLFWVTLLILMCHIKLARFDTWEETMLYHRCFEWLFILIMCHIKLARFDTWEETMLYHRCFEWLLILIMCHIKLACFDTWEEIMLYHHCLSDSVNINVSHQTGLFWHMRRNYALPSLFWVTLLILMCHIKLAHFDTWEEIMLYHRCFEWLC